MPAFSEWLRVEISTAIDSTNKPSTDVMEASHLPKVRATGYCHMHAHGMHFHIRDAKEEKITCDSAIVASIWKSRIRRYFKESREMEMVHYVGWIHKILELDYRNHYYIVLLCSWVPATLQASNFKSSAQQIWLCIGKLIVTNETYSKLVCISNSTSLGFLL